MERAERSGGLHKRSAEAWGHPLRARGAELPLAAFVVPFALQTIRAGVAGRNGPAWMGSGNRSLYRQLQRGKGEASFPKTKSNRLAVLVQLAFSETDSRK